MTIKEMFNLLLQQNTEIVRRLSKIEMILAERKVHTASPFEDIPLRHLRSLFQQYLPIHQDVPPPQTPPNSLASAQSGSLPESDGPAGFDPSKADFSALTAKPAQSSNTAGQG